MCDHPEIRKHAPRLSSLAQRHCRTVVPLHCLFPRFVCCPDLFLKRLRQRRRLFIHACKKWSCDHRRCVAGVSNQGSCCNHRTSTDLSHDIPDWPALNVPGSALSSFKTKKKYFVEGSGCCFFLDVVHSADSQAFANEGELGLRILTWLKALMHCSSDVCFRLELGLPRIVTAAKVRTSAISHSESVLSRSGT